MLYYKNIPINKWKRNTFMNCMNQWSKQWLSVLLTSQKERQSDITCLPMKYYDLAKGIKSEFDENSVLSCQPKGNTEDRWICELYHECALSKIQTSKDYRLNGSGSSTINGESGESGFKYVKHIANKKQLDLFSAVSFSSKLFNH